MSTLTRTEHAVARSLAETAEPRDALARALQAIGEGLGWRFGAVWEPALDRPDALRCVETWSAVGAAAHEFEAISRSIALPAGEGLPGRVWDSGEPAWIPDVLAEENFPRAPEAHRAGLHAAFCFPVRSARGVLGVIEFFTGEPRRLDPELLETMSMLGDQVGQAVEHRRVAEALRAREARHRAMLDAALDCVVTMDHEGRIVDFNPAAERTFGFRAGDAVGREMAELIIPPELRERHRRGLACYLASEEPVLLDRRVEIRGMRADGTTFPVELTITRIDVPGPPTFVGYLRDITDRKAAEAELRASRARIVAAADDARRRLERDLHDGAQQRLDELALDLRTARARLMEEPALVGELLDAALGDLREATRELRELTRVKFNRAPSHRCGVTLMDNQAGHAVAAALKGKPGVTVTYTRSMIRVDADRRLEFGFEELSEAVGEEFDQDTFEQIMSTHYGRMVALDDRIVLFADPEDAADHLGFDLRDAT